MSAVTPKEPGAPQSAAAPSPFPPIADYAFLSDCHTGALVAPDGAIDWLCVPRFDAPSVFGSLLDREAGFFRFGPFGINHPTARVYEPGTNVLVTTWKTPSGWVVVRDALTMGPWDHEDTITPHTRPPADDDADHMLVRTVECLEGRVEVELVCEPVFDYGRTPATWTLVDGGRHAADATGGGHDDPARVRPRARHRGRPRPRRATCSSAGERAYCALSWAEGLAAPGERRRGRGADRRDDPLLAQLARAARGSPTTAGATRSSARRSTIKGLTYMPTGATVAALTTSLPETPGGERNWDYRYTWMRDTTFTLQALHFLNLDWEADEFMQFVADLEPNEDGSLQIMYGIDGRRDLTESTRDDLSGYAGARPVRIGNGAFDQRQNDVFGAVLDSILLHTRHSAPPAAAALADRAVAGGVRDAGLARARPGHLGGARASRSTTSRRSSCAGSRSTARRSSPRSAATRSCTTTWRATADEIRADILEHGVTRRRPAPALRDRLARRLDAARGDLRLPAPTTTRAARHRAGDRRRPDRGRLRPALPDRRDRRRALGQGGHVPDLLVLARVGARDRRRDAAGARPDGAAAADRLAARALRRGVRRSHRPAPRQLPAGVLAPRADRGGRADHRPRDAGGVLDGQPTTSSSSARARAAARSPAASAPPASGSSCSSAATGSRASRRTGSRDEVFVENRYVSPETWYDERGKPFQPQVHYFVGGATKLYGAALYRLRAEDFGELRHHDGISPAWPISYDELEPYYTRAEQLYQVHGARGEDPTEPPASAPYPHPGGLARAADPAARGRPRGRGPSPVPRALRDHARRVEPALQRLRALHELRRLPVRGARQVRRGRARRAAGDPDTQNVTLLTNARAIRLDTNDAGTAVTEVVVEHDGRDRALHRPTSSSSPAAPPTPRSCS